MSNTAQPLPSELCAVVADSANHGLIVLDAEERVVLWNQWVSQRSNIEAATALGSELAEVFSKGLDPRIQRAIHGALGSGASSIVASVFHSSPLPFYSLDRNGGLLSLSITVRPIAVGGGARHCLIEINDVTSSRNRERLLRDQAKEVQQQNEELGRSNEQLDEFAHIVSHDLKEPLRGIRMFSTFLLEDYGSRLDDEGRSRLSRLIGLSERMHNLIDSVLHFSKVGRTELAYGDVSIPAVVDGVIESLRITLDEANVDVQVADSLPTVYCDEARVSEVFRNLVTNAMKYNDKPDKRIRIGAEERTGDAPGTDETVFFVEDNGIGIKKEHIDQIFRIFRRLHTRDAYGGGTGVGMTIAKKIVERHGGRLWLESQENEGTTFFFTLAGPGGAKPGAQPFAVTH